VLEMLIIRYFDTVYQFGELLRLFFQEEGRERIGETREERADLRRSFFGRAQQSSETLDRITLPMESASILLSLLDCIRRR